MSGHVNTKMSLSGYVAQAKSDGGFGIAELPTSTELPII